MKRTHWLRVLGWALGAAGMMIAGTARAQFTASYQTNIISGVLSNWVGDYYVVIFDQLQVMNAGALNDSGNLYISINGGTGNSLVISNGGKVVNLHFSHFLW